MHSASSVSFSKSREFSLFRVSSIQGHVSAVASQLWCPAQQWVQRSQWHVVASHVVERLPYQRPASVWAPITEHKQQVLDGIQSDWLYYGSCADDTTQHSYRNSTQDEKTVAFSALIRSCPCFSTEPAGCIKKIKSVSIRWFLNLWQVTLQIEALIILSLFQQLSDLKLYSVLSFAIFLRVSGWTNGLKLITNLPLFDGLAWVSFGTAVCARIAVLPFTITNTTRTWIILHDYIDLSSFTRASFSFRLSFN